MDCEVVFKARVSKGGGDLEIDRVMGLVKITAPEPTCATGIIGEGEDVAERRDVLVMMFEQNSDYRRQEFQAVVGYV